MSFWDTSALVKLYLPEADSDIYEKLASTADSIVVSHLTSYEARAVFRRREAEGALPAGQATFLYKNLTEDMAAGQIEVVEDELEIEREYGVVLEVCLSQKPPVYIRTLDALHLAAAKVSGERDLITADMRQKTAAELIGLSVYP